jgi:hypothetical protein
MAKAKLSPEEDRAMSQSNGNGYTDDGMDVNVTSTQKKVSDYTMADEPAPRKVADTSAYTTPEDDLVKIVPVGLGAIAVRSRPPRDDWFRAHPEGTMATGMTLVKGKMGELHAVRSELIPIVGPEVTKALVRASVTACMTVDGAKFLWAILHPAGNANQQHYDNAISARDLARSTWIRFYWDANQESHITVTPKHSTAADPKWPDATLDAWIDKAFRGKFIDNVDDPLFRKIRGEL